MEIFLPALFAGPQRGASLPEPSCVPPSPAGADSKQVGGGLASTSAQSSAIAASISDLARQKLGQQSTSSERARALENAPRPPWCSSPLPVSSPNLHCLSIWPAHRCASLSPWSADRQEKDLNHRHTRGHDARSHLASGCDSTSPYFARQITCLQSNVFVCCGHADLVRQLSASSREVPLVTMLNGTLMARRSWSSGLVRFAAGPQ
jgi:hypothetical protein